MNNILVFVGLVFLGAGPEFDSIESETLDAETREALPSGRHLGSYGDLFFVDLVNLQNAGGGGIARFDQLMQSSHGFSWMQMSWRLNGLEISDPLRPGSPIVSLPSGVWSALAYRSLWADQPTFDLTVELPKSETSEGRLALRTGAEIGGGTWLPPGFMDREPATILGVNPDRRALSRANEISLSYLGYESVIALEVTRHNHHYPTLVGDDGGMLEDVAEEVAGIATGPLNWLGSGSEWLLAGSFMTRIHDQSQFRYPLAYTHALEEQSVVGSLAGKKSISDLSSVEWTLGAMYRRDAREGWDSGAPTVDVEAQWTWLARPKSPDNEDRLKVGGEVILSTQGEAWFDGLPGSLEVLSSAYRSWTRVSSALQGEAIGTTWLSGRGSVQDSGAARVAIYEEGTRIEQTLDDARVRLEWQHQMGDLELRVNVGSNLGVAGGPSLDTLWFVDPGMGAALRWKRGDYEFFGLLRREPEVLTANVGAFLDSQSPSGLVHQWLDDGDGTYQAGEEGSVVRSTGGAFHMRDPDLYRATSNQLSFGLRVNEIGSFDFIWKNDARLHLGRYTVRYDASSSPSYTQQEVADPHIGETITAWAREPGGEGHERYELTNSGDPNLFMGTGLAWVSRPGRPWFVNLSAVAYFSVGTAPHGLYADVNDPSVLSEDSADPNLRVNALGRFDACRAFGVNLLTGFRPLKDTSVGILLRYRDGEPITRFVVADLPQGATPLMAVPRGAPIPRHTFHMTLDAKLRYEPKIWGVDTVIALDVYNILGSGTELLEDFTTGPEYRRSLEMVPGRSGMLSLELGW